MRPWSFVALLLSCMALSLSFAPAQDLGAAPACALCTDRTVECPTCAGAGVLSGPCGFCLGKGKVECSSCPSARPGWIDCPNRYCRDGKSQWQGGDADPCKLCAAKGRIPCPSCRGQKPVPCIACAGIGARSRTCPTCVGGKRIPCPLCTLDPARGGCSTCDGSGKATCRLCASSEAKGSGPCFSCNGRGDIACASCVGLDRVACTKCGATGKMRMVSSKYPGLPAAPGEKAGVKQCEWCEGKATKNCPDCKKGRVDCKYCEKGQVPNACVHCVQQRAIGCDECLSGGYSRWETLGELLLAKGQASRARLFFARALAAAQAMTGPVRLAELHLTMLDLQAKFAALEKARRQLAGAAGEAVAKPDPPRLPAAAELELFWPLAVRQRYWPDAPVGQEISPWRDEKWMTAHRARTVARLEAALAKANAAAGK